MKKNLKSLVAIKILVVVSIVLSGCKAFSSQIAVAETYQFNEMTMAERILFHDQILDRGIESFSIADRITFHDYLWDQKLDKNEISTDVNAREMTMAERILFHDLLWAQRQ